jgi:hypothetical protein
LLADCHFGFLDRQKSGVEERPDHLCGGDFSKTRAARPKIKTDQSSDAFALQKNALIETHFSKKENRQQPAHANNTIKKTGVYQPQSRLVPFPQTFQISRPSVIPAFAVLLPIRSR